LTFNERLHPERGQSNMPKQKDNSIPVVGMLVIVDWSPRVASSEPVAMTILVRERMIWQFD
jgi:hypothetical protein